MSEWRPIETAPKDGTTVDLWMVDESGAQWREADAYFVTGRIYEQIEFAPDGSHQRVFGRRDGWWAPNHDYDGDPGWCDFPRRYNSHPKQQRWQFTLPTHWMPLPEPPK